MSDISLHLSGEGWKNRSNADLVKVSLRALKAAISAADPRGLIRRSVKLSDDGRLAIGSLSLRPSDFRRILVIGGGKASALMAAEVERLLGASITGGVVIIPDYQKKYRLERILLRRASHPLPGRAGLKGVEEMLELVSHPSKDDLIFCLISGGGSALMTAPRIGITLHDKMMTTKLLLASGAPIEEINAVRKHLSEIKGGRLAAKLYPAKVVSFILSDVVGDRIDTVASGPTAPDETTFLDARRVIKTYGLMRRAPSVVRSLIEKGVDGKVEETPKRESRVFRDVHNIVIGSNLLARNAASEYLAQRGFRTVALRGELKGEARIAGAALARRLLRGNPRVPTAFVTGGETTVNVKGRGGGGRDQEAALAAAMALSMSKGTLLATLATDGIDGPTDAAGAIVDGTTVERARKVGLDAYRCLERNDSYTLLRKLGDLLVSGPTGTGVNDIFIAMSAGS